MWTRVVDSAGITYISRDDKKPILQVDVGGTEFKATSLCLGKYGGIGFVNSDNTMVFAKKLVAANFIDKDGSINDRALLEEYKKAIKAMYEQAGR